MPRLKEMYRSEVHYEYIARAAAELSCPVIANGNIYSAEKGAEVLRWTGARGLMIGRSAIVVGIVFGLGIFFATNFLVLKGGEVVGPHLALLGQCFIGYRVSFLGSLIGLAYGLVIGFGIGYGVAFLYNWIAALREGKGR